MTFHPTRAASLHPVALREPVPEFRVVGHEHNDAALVERSSLEQEVRDARRGLAVQVAGRLVAKQEAGGPDQGARDRDPLLLSAREFSREVVEPARQPYPVEERRRPRAVILARFRKRGREHVLEGRALRQEAVVLEHEADPVAAEPGLFVGGEFVGIHPVEPDHPVGGDFDRAEQEEQRALAASGGAHHRSGFSGLEVHVHSVEHAQEPGRRRVVLDEIGDFEARGCGHR